MLAQAVVERKVLARVDIPPLRRNAAVNGEKRSISKKQALFVVKTLINDKLQEIPLPLHKKYLMFFL